MSAAHITLTTYDANHTSTKVLRKLAPERHPTGRRTARNEGNPSELYGCTPLHSQRNHSNTYHSILRCNRQLYCRSNQKRNWWGLHRYQHQRTYPVQFDGKPTVWERSPILSRGQRRGAPPRLRERQGITQQPKFGAKPSIPAERKPERVGLYKQNHWRIHTAHVQWILPPCE